MRKGLQKGFRLGEYDVQPLTGQISGPGGTRHLTPKAVDVLLCLAEHPGEVLSHRRILEAAWGDSAHGHDVLAHCVSSIRACLDDHSDRPSYIRTVPKRGYQLIAPVTPVGSAETMRPAGPPHRRDSRGGFAGFWTALKERNVVRVSIAYAAVSWLLLQFAQIAFDALVFPDWSMRVFVFVIAAGFLVAVVLAWAYQVVPETGSRKYPGRSPAATWINQGIDVGIIVALVIAVGLVAYRQFVDKPVFAPVEASLPPLDLPEPERNSVAVLRFANLGADERFSDGLAENLLHMLARMREVSVPSRSTTWSLSDDELNLVELAEQLRVRYVLEGSVQQQDDNIRVFAQLIDGLSGKHVWSENYDRPLTADNFFRTQDDIAAKVVEQIQVTLSGPSTSRLDRQPTGNLTALRHYLGGRQYLRQPMSPETLESAVAEFERAIALDAGYVEAHAGLCEAHLGWYVTNRDGDSFDRAERACLRAAELDASSPEVHAAMGGLHRYAGRYAEAELQLRKALELSPRSAAVLEELGRTYQADNRLVEAEQAFREAIRAEPRSWSVYKSMGNFLFRTGRYDQALPYYRQVIALEPADSAGYNNLAVTLFMLGRFDDANLVWTRVINDAPTRLTYVNYANSLYYSKDYERSVAMYRKAIDMDPNDHRAWRSMGASLLQLDPQGDAAREAYERAVALALDNVRVNPGDQEALSQIAVSYARLGRHELARDALRRLREIGWEDPNMSYFVALAHHLLGEDDTAIRELERAVIMGFPRPLISGDPDFQTLTNNERYVALVTAGTNLPGT